MLRVSRGVIGRALLVGAAFVLSAAWLIAYDAGGETDFNIFYQAALHWRDPYAPEALAGLPGWMQNGRSPFVYPPTFLLLVKPFTLLPYEVAYIAWSAGSLSLFLLAASFLSQRAAWILLASPFAVLLAIGFGAPVTYQPILFGLMTGQTAFFTGAGLIFAGLALEKHPRLAGVLLALVVCLKPTAALVAPVLLLGNPRGLVAAILAGSAAVLVSFVLGPALWLDWLQALRGFPGGVVQLQPAKAVPHAAWQVALVLLGVLLAWRERNLTGLLVGTVLCAPYLMPYDLSALAALGLSKSMTPRNWPLIALGAALAAGVVFNSAILAAGVITVAALTLTAPRRTPSSTWMLRSHLRS
jgi:hypothetical protein